MSAFEHWATSQSVVEDDPALMFESQILKDAFLTWSAQAAGGIPSRHTFNPRLVKSFVGNLVIFERQDSLAYLVRLMGTHVAMVIGEMQGKLVGDALPSDVAGRWNAALDHVLSTLRPRRMVNRVGLPNLSFLEAEIFLAPLLDGRGRATMVLAVVAFCSGIAAGHSAILDERRGEAGR